MHATGTIQLNYSLLFVSSFGDWMLNGATVVGVGSLFWLINSHNYSSFGTVFIFLFF
jgi:hypothetical protein